jgi:tetratricopeptide (TPR) repeat protein
MLSLVAIAVVAAVSPVQRAEQLYNQARYEDALKALGRSCQSVRESEQVACEKVRAFAQVALGREAEARAAFDRLIVANPDADLGADVSPKLQSLFSSAKREIAQVMSLQLEPVSPGVSAGGGANAPWPLTVRVPGDVYLDALHAHIATASTSRYSEVTLRSQDGVWIGMYEPPTEPSAPRYYLVATLSSGVNVSVGDAASAKAVVVSAAPLDPLGYDPLEPQHAEPAALAATRRGDDDEKIAGLPPWAFWTVVGGSAAVVTSVLVYVLTRGGGDEPGAVRVGLTFQ